MQFKEGADVLTADGEKIGSVDRVVMNPQTGEMTHIVIRKGFLFVEDKVLPVSLVANATEDEVTLRGIADDPDEYPNFEETQYILIDEVERTARQEPARYARPVYWYPPVGVPTWRPAADYLNYFRPPYVIETVRNIPEGAVALKEGARVISSDGKHVGDIEQVFVDPQDEEVTHLVLSRGLLLKERKVIPSVWLSRVFEDEVHLAVSSTLLDGLPDYQG